MRHRVAGVKLNRTSSHREAMFRNMVTSLLKHQRIKTTDVKARELRRWVDHVITLAKRGDLHARRQVLAIVREKDVVHKLFNEAEKRFGNIHGGYTRLVKIGARAGDGAPVSLIELVSIEEQPKKKTSKDAAKKKAALPETTAAAAAAGDVKEKAAQEQISGGQAEAKTAANAEGDDQQTAGSNSEGTESIQTDSAEERKEPK